MLRIRTLDTDFTQKPREGVQFTWSQVGDYQSTGCQPPVAVSTKLAPTGKPEALSILCWPGGTENKYFEEHDGICSKVEEVCVP